MSRLDRLYTLLQNAHLDAVALIPGANMKYLTGANPLLMERPIILFLKPNAKPVFVLPSLELDVVAQHGFDADFITWTDSEGYDGAIEKAAGQLQLSNAKVGVEGLHMRYFEAEALRRAEPTLQVYSADEDLSHLRIIKDAEEIAAHRKAVEIAEAALTQTLTEVKIGMTELQIQKILEAHMEALGGEKLPFESIVLGGGASAQPHGHARPDYAIQAGDPLLFDFGTTHKGYLSDITRTFFVGSVSDHFRDVYEAVLAANTAGREAIRPGVTAGSIDDAARAALVEHGFEHLIIHRTGHGIGLLAHEYPNIVAGNDTVLQAGMAFTVEPGLYETDAIGVRIEDDVVVTENGYESLTTFSREITVIDGR